MAVTSLWVSQRATSTAPCDETLGDRVRADAWAVDPDVESWDEHQQDVDEFLQGVEHGRWARENIADALDYRHGEPTISDTLKYGPAWALGYVSGAVAPDLTGWAPGEIVEAFGS